jgi:hypothetical protein
MRLPATITQRASLTMSLKNDEVLRAKYFIEHWPRVSIKFWSLNEIWRFKKKSKPLMLTMTFPLSRGCVNASRNVAKIANEFEIRCSVDSINTLATWLRKTKIGWISGY